jgi:hypothetical protein
MANKLSHEDVMAALNDPTLVQAAAAKLGLQVRPFEKPAPKVRERPKFEIPEAIDRHELRNIQKE